MMEACDQSMADGLLDFKTRALPAMLIVYAVE
jgi:hypothetical protein